MNYIQFNSIESRSGLPIIEAVVDGKTILLHSKYDPVREAQRFIDSCSERIEAAEHILFYGVGMGYHIKAFTEQYPEKLISAYEPFEEIANLALNQKSVNTSLQTGLNHFIVQTKGQSLEEALSKFKSAFYHNFEIIVLPSYGGWQNEQLKAFIETLKKTVEIQKINTQATYEFSRRWTINALMNLPKTMEHPNFLIEKKEVFKGKPVIIASAGPSLSDEIENLRQIKASGTAYIFAVGSANKALIKEGVYPDAVCTYDPQNHNYAVFGELIQKNIDFIPMIYGTTVGFETINLYKGPKLYFPVSQDRLTYNFHSDRQIMVNDATTIAVVTLQLLHYLEVSKVILVGQNLAYKDDQFYAEGIVRYDEDNIEKKDHYVSEKDLHDVSEVGDVHGGKVCTNFTFRLMKLDMEAYIKLMNIPVINTTVSGAAIEGTTFKYLKDLIVEDLTSKVVVENWWEQSVDKNTVINKSFIRKYIKDFECFEDQLNELFQSIADLKQALTKLTDYQIQKKYDKLNNQIKKYNQNIFFNTTILSIAQLAFERIKSENQLIIAMTDIKKKAQKVIEMYPYYLQQCQLTYRDIAPVLSNFTLRQLSEMLGSSKLYEATSGVFYYEGEWSKKSPTAKVPEGLSEEEQRAWYKVKKLEDKIELPIALVETTQKSATIRFRFKGTCLSLYGVNVSNEDLRLNVQIDQKSRLVAVHANNTYSHEHHVHKCIFTASKLQNKVHEVTIQVLSDHPHFLFDGIEIEPIGRAYHIHEVERVEDLAVGKRIRCHYEATYNRVGEFSQLGEEIANFLPIDACAEPDGDFYFIMVDEIEGEKKMIADRNIQNYMSYTTLKNTLLNNKSKKKIDGIGYITLPSMGRFKGDNENDWYKYIESKNTPSENLYWNFIEHTINFGSDTLNDYPEKGVFRGKFHNSKGTSFGVNAHDWFMITGVDGAYSTYAFRPMLIGEKKL